MSGIADHLIQSVLESATVGVEEPRRDELVVVEHVSRAARARLTEWRHRAVRLGTTQQLLREHAHILRVRGLQAVRSLKRRRKYRD